MNSFIYDNKILEIILSTIIALTGGLFVIFDTSYVLKESKPGDEVQAALELHLDVRLIFIRILDLFGETNDTNGENTPNLDFD